jgi:hypothetical protein
LGAGALAVGETSTGIAPGGSSFDGEALPLQPTSPALATMLIATSPIPASRHFISLPFLLVLLDVTHP